jgi:MFS family permease
VFDVHRVTFPSFLRALNSRNYRLFYFGQMVSLVGNWMTTTTSAWLAYQLSGSAFYVGLVGFATQIPLLVLAPFTGVGGDRVDRRRRLVWLQVLSGLQSAALAVFAFSGHMTIAALIALCLAQGLINAWEFPTRQSFVIEMVDDKRDLPNAIALNSSMFNVARLAGPALAGVLILVWGAGVCYALDAVSYLPVIGSLLAMRTIPRPVRTKTTSRLKELLEGLRHAAHEPGLRRPLLMVAVNALAGFGASILAPVFAASVFHGDSRLLGNFYSAIGAGALVSAILLSTRTQAEDLRRWVVRGSALVGLGQAMFALSPSIALAYVALMATGSGVVLVMAGSNTLIQARVDDDKRSRVMGLFATGQGMFPVGSFLIGSLASATTPRIAVGVCAGVCLIAAAIYRSVRPAATVTRPAADAPRAP